MNDVTKWLNFLRRTGARMNVPDQHARHRAANNLLMQMPCETSRLIGEIGHKEMAGQKLPRGLNAEEIRQKAEAENAAVLTKAYVSEWMFAEDWAKSAFAQIIVEPKLFASFAATSIPRDLVPDLSMPWDTFVVRVPDELLGPPVQWGADSSRMAPIAYYACWARAGYAWGGQPLPGEEEKAEMSAREAGRLMGIGEEVFDRVEAVSEEFQLSIPDKKRFMLSIRPAGLHGAEMLYSFDQLGDLYGDDGGHGVVWDGTLSPFGEEGIDSKKDIDLSVPEAMRLSLDFARRAFAGVILEMMDPRYGPAIEQARKRGVVRRGGEPTSTTIELRRPISVDCRGWLRAAQSGAGGHGKSPSVRTLVRGHWKMQPCGPGGVDRRPRHIEPYWRGPNDGPVVVRPHVLGKVSAS